MGLVKAIPVDACEGIIGCSNEDMGGSGGCFVVDELDEGGGLNENAELFVTGVGWWWWRVIVNRFTLVGLVGKGRWFRHIHNNLIKT